MLQCTQFFIILQQTDALNAGKVIPNGTKLYMTLNIKQCYKNVFFRSILKSNQS